MFTKPLHRQLICGLSAALLCLGGTAAQAAYPDHPITIVVNFSAGGPLDLTARLLAANVSSKLHQSVIVQDKAGASGMIGGEYVARAKPDGYTLLLSLDILDTVNPFVYKNNPFNANKDLTVIGQAGTSSNVLVTKAGLGPTTLKELIALAAKKSLSYSSAGNASPGRLTMETLRLATNLKMTHIPYKGNAPAVNAVLSGQVDSGFLASTNLTPYIKAHKVVALVVSGDKRDPLLPDVPTVAESGIPGLENFNMSFSFVLMAPAHTPPEIVKQWNTLLNEFMKDPNVLKKLEVMDLQPTYGTPEQTQAAINKAAQVLKKTIEKANIVSN